VIWIGVDPGLDGAIGVLRLDDTLAVHDMPTLKVGAGGKRVIDHAALASLIDGIHRDGTPQLAVIEQVASSPQMGVASAFAFGDGNGIVKGVLAAHFVPLRFVTPPSWKRALRIPAGSGKDVSRQRASELFPRSVSMWQRVKDDGRADAALLAWHARDIWRRETREAA
jgi:crossover junction endodeoxyribonuclease RuvC